MMVTVTSRLFSPYLRDRAESYLKKFAKRAKTQTPVEWRIDEKTLTGKVFRKNQSGTFLDTDGTRYSLAKTPRMIRLTSSTLTHAELTALNHRRPLPPETFDARYLPHPMLQIVVDYEPPSDWQVVAVCDPSDPNEPTGSPAIWTPMFGENCPKESVGANCPKNSSTTATTAPAVHGGENEPSSSARRKVKRKSLVRPACSRTPGYRRTTSKN